MVLFDPYAVDKASSLERGALEFACIITSSGWPDWNLCLQCRPCIVGSINVLIRSKLLWIHLYLVISKPEMLSSYLYHPMSCQYMKPAYNCHHTINNLLRNLFPFPHSYYYGSGNLVKQLIMYQVNIFILLMLFSGSFSTNEWYHNHWLCLTAIPWICFM